MAYNWKVRKAAVEQVIEFPSKEAYRNCLEKMKNKGTQFEVLQESYCQDGTVIVLMRKCYNNNIFLRRNEVNRMLN